MDIKFPTLEDVEKASPFWKYLFKLREVNVYINLIFIIYILYNFKINHYIFTILILLLLSSTTYFLFVKRYIYYIIKKNNDNFKIVKFMDANGSLYINAAILLYSIYAMIIIFVLKNK